MSSNRKSFRSTLLKWFGITDQLSIKVYHGYGHTDKMIIYGHVLKQGPLPRKKYRKNVIKNSWALLRLFMVKPLRYARVQANWHDLVLQTETDEHGFFKFEWKSHKHIEYGWHEMTFQLFHVNGQLACESKGHVYVPHDTQFGFISDVDDTFLISHSANLRKRLFVLFTQNARSRQPFDGSIRHYKLLAEGNTTPDSPNPFFYVSSSEWNLYDYLHEFARMHELPKGVFLLNVLKKFNGLLQTGQNNHQGKFTRIVRIIESYPRQRFVLLGDSSQHDPYIYESIVRHFPQRIHAVYIRDVHHANTEKVKDVLASITSSGVPCCFFKHSHEAILHSHKIGLITTAEAVKSIEQTS